MFQVSFKQNIESRASTKKACINKRLLKKIKDLEFTKGFVKAYVWSVALYEC